MEHFYLFAHDIKMSQRKQKRKREQSEPDISLIFTKEVITTLIWPTPQPCLHLSQLINPFSPTPQAVEEKKEVSPKNYWFILCVFC